MGDLWAQNRQKGNIDNRHGETRPTQAVPCRYWLQHTSSNESKSDRIRANHPLTMKSETPAKRRDHCDNSCDDPCRDLDAYRFLEIIRFRVMGICCRQDSKGSRNKNSSYI